MVLAREKFGPGVSVGVGYSGHCVDTIESFCVCGGTLDIGAVVAGVLKTIDDDELFDEVGVGYTGHGVDDTGTNDVGLIEGGAEVEE